MQCINYYTATANDTDSIIISAENVQTNCDFHQYQLHVLWITILLSSYTWVNFSKAHRDSTVSYTYYLHLMKSNSLS